MVNTVSGDTILQEQQVAGDGDGVHLTGLQQVGVRLALGVGIVAVIIILMLGYQWISQTPSEMILPSIPSDPATAPQVITNTRVMIENNKALHDIALDGPMKLADQLILKVLFPAFTAIMGYIFGTAQSSGKASE